MIFSTTLLGKVWQKSTFGKSTAKIHFWEKCGKKVLFISEAIKKSVSVTNMAKPKKIVSISFCVEYNVFLQKL